MNIVCWTSLKVFLNVSRTEEKLEKEHKMLILENRAVFWDGFGPDGQTNVNWVSNPQVDPGRAALGCVGGRPEFLQVGGKNIKIYVQISIS